MRAFLKLNVFIVLAVALLPTSQCAEAAEPSPRYLIQRVQRLIHHAKGLPLDIRTGAPALQSYYAAPTAKPLWTKVKRRDELLAVLSELETDGLAETTRAVARLSEMGQAANSDDTGLLALMELTYSTYLIRYVTTLRLGHMGRYEEQLDVRTRERIIRPGAVLLLASETPSIWQLFEKIQPDEPDYWRLKARLKDYLKAERRGGWLPVTPGRDLSVGERDPRVTEIRRRLVSSEELSTKNISGELFDDVLASAVELFQRRHGLAQTGKVDRRTVLAMNVPLRERIKQLRVNLERWRWFDDARPGPRWIINTATRRLYVRVPQKTARSFELTLSQACRQRPAFDTTARSLVVDPQFTVPKTLAVREILPVLKRDPLQLDESFTILLTTPQDRVPKKIDWQDYDETNFPFTITQQPHPTNPLGRFQVPFEKVSDITLHGKPRAKPRLKIDHPCAAVSNEREFLEIALATSGGDVIDLVSSEGPNRKISLPEPVPVVFIYATVWMDTDGELIFGADPLGRDRELHRLLTDSEVS